MTTCHKELNIDDDLDLDYQTVCEDGLKLSKKIWSKQIPQCMFYGILNKHNKTSFGYVDMYGA